MRAHLSQYLLLWRPAENRPPIAARKNQPQPKKKKNTHTRVPWNMHVCSTPLLFRPASARRSLDWMLRPRAGARTADAAPNSLQHLFDDGARLFYILFAALLGRRGRCQPGKRCRIHSFGNRRQSPVKAKAAGSSLQDICCVRLCRPCRLLMACALHQ